MLLDAKQLAGIALFDGMTQEQMTFLTAHARQRSYRGEEAIVHQQDSGENFYVILRGTVKISSTLADGSEVFLALLASGDTFGEMSLIDSAFRSADAVTQEPTNLVIIDRPTFDALIERAPAFTRNLLKILARRLRLANVRIQAHATFDVYGRVARQLLEFCDLYGQKQPNGDTLIPIRLTQGDIAQLVGASRERVNQVMVAYRQRGLLTVAPNYHITVHKPVELEKRMQ
jgi:CRP/FNR family cyclic AMP-dependent transcriptional regulator